MSLSRRLILVAATAVAVAIALASTIAFLAVRSELRGQVDDSLRGLADELAALREAPPPPALSGPAPAVRAAPPPPDVMLPAPAPFGGPRGFVQIVTAQGDVEVPPGEEQALPVSARARDVAAGRADRFFADATVDGTHVRVLTAPAAPGQAVQVARPLDEVDRSLRDLGLALLAVSVAGIGLAAALGWLVSRTALAPVGRLTGAAEHVAATRDLSSRIDAAGDDELARLARSFNTMLEALEESVRSQKQLVADASHELRTPLTSLRTNIELLATGSPLPAGDRARLMADVVAQLEDLSGLVGDLVEMARDERSPAGVEAVRLDELVRGAVERARRHDRGARIALDAEPSLIDGAPGRIDRAVANVLDNAIKWSPPEAPIEVEVRSGQVLVRDHGPGISDADLPLIFDRFYRAPAARGRPGTGLGLAIVRQVVESHGGHIRVEAARGGGTRMTLAFSAKS